MTMTRMRAVVPLICFVFLITGCETPPGKRATIGGLGGRGWRTPRRRGRGGGTGIAAGVILGGLVGGAIGDRMDAADRREAQRAATQAFDTAPLGAERSWRNPDSGNSGVSPPHAPTRRPVGNTAGSFSRRSPLAARASKPSAGPVASLTAVGKLSVEPVYGLSHLSDASDAKEILIMPRCVLPFVIAMLIIASTVYGQQQPAAGQQAMWDNADKNKDGVIDRTEFLGAMTDAFFLCRR